MARFKILSIAEKQRILYQQAADSAQLKAWGDFYLGEGRTYDAIEFYERAGASDKLAELQRQAIADGNGFLYRRAGMALKTEPKPSDLEALASHCNSAGRIAYARVARGEPAMEPPASEETDEDAS